VAARREWAEEIGFDLGDAELVPLGEVCQPGGKRVHAWAVAGDCDVDEIRSNTFTMEWPARSGRKQEFPEIDRAAWFDLADARESIRDGSVPAPRTPRAANSLRRSTAHQSSGEQDLP
jgi:predicted NUDIX family NTP pyrophosphohydrolase